jgi:hypothetical protein
VGTPTLQSPVPILVIDGFSILRGCSKASVPVLLDGGNCIFRQLLDDRLDPPIVPCGAQEVS